MSVHLSDMPPLAAALLLGVMCLNWRLL